MHSWWTRTKAWLSRDQIWDDVFTRTVSILMSSAVIGLFLALTGVLDPDRRAWAVIVGMVISFESRLVSAGERGMVAHPAVEQHSGRHGCGGGQGGEGERVADLPLWPLAAYAADLLRSGPLHQLSRCGHCRWLFLDTSKNHSRRWCSMNSCGSVVKMRRYRAARRS